MRLSPTGSHFRHLPWHAGGAAAALNRYGAAGPCGDHDSIAHHTGHGRVDAQPVHGGVRDQPDRLRPAGGPFRAAAGAARRPGTVRSGRRWRRRWRPRFPLAGRTAGAGGRRGGRDDAGFRHRARSVRRPRGADPPRLHHRRSQYRADPGADAGRWAAGPGRMARHLWRNGGERLGADGPGAGSASARRWRCAR